MKKFAITGKYEGVVYAAYNISGHLMMLDLSGAKLDENQIRYYWKNIATNLIMLHAFLESSRLQAVEVIAKVTFNDFYEEYGVKEGKKRAEAAWNKMPEAEQVKAFLYIPKIKGIKQRNGQAMPHPITYLNQTRWND